MHISSTTMPNDATRSRTPIGKLPAKHLKELLANLAPARRAGPHRPAGR